MELVFEIALKSVLMILMIVLMIHQTNMTINSKK